jgi:hypothetical protein
MADCNGFARPYCHHRHPAAAVGASSPVCDAVAMMSDYLFADLPGALDDGDRLFNSGGPWQFNAKMDWTFLREIRYVQGFKRAAEVLGEHVAAHRSDITDLTMPILFCYRQWIELYLKDFLVIGMRLRGEEVTRPTGHNLRALWGDARPIIEEVWPEDDHPEQLDRLEARLHELADLDGPSGTGFRYALGRTGESSLPDDVSINLQNVAHVMAKVAWVLDGAAELLAEELARHREMS